MQLAGGPCLFSSCSNDRINCRNSGHWKRAGKRKQATFQLARASRVDLWIEFRELIRRGETVASVEL